MQIGALSKRLVCLGCGLLNAPSSSSRSICTISRSLLASTISRVRPRNYVNLQFRRNVNVIDTKRESLKLRNTTWSDLKNIFSLAVPYKGRILLGMAFLGLSSSIFLFCPRVLGKLIDEHDEQKRADMEKRPNDFTLKLAKYFKENPLAIVGILTIGAAAICARAYCMHTAGQLVINDLRTKVFGSILKQDMAFFDKNKVGELVSRLSTDALIVGYSVSMNLSDGARALITCLGSGSLMVYTSPALCKVVAVVIPIIVGTFYVFGKLQRKYTLLMQEAVAGANQVATERLANVKTVRMLVAEKKELQAYKGKINEIWDISRREGIAKGLMFGSFQFTGYMALTSILFYGSSLINQGLLTYGDLSSFCLYAILCASSMSSISGFFTELMKGLGASARLFELRSREPLIPIAGGIQKDGVQHEIRFENVVFQYADRSRIFNDVDFTIPAGKITAVVGHSGSGKSTVANLLLRLYDPSEGRITVDGVDLRDIDPSHWRRQIGTVGQEPTLFSTTIWNNIVYGAEKPELVSNSAVQQAAAQSNSLEFIQSFPQGFQTMVGEHGSSMLSGGQKQRIAIARALVNNPKILILDEATSALDATSEYFVRIALNKLLENSNQTIVIIAHRLSTIKHADQIVVLDGGGVAEVGTFDELLKIDDGIFKKLVEKQTMGWQDEF
ncbi:hypothetical protein QR680_004687 [Steinernema hermaphroditum]|uniref:Uncharacterized protein n=1 Tax=Steinernema hermaphroditum TaxID=289476 RepID=A0AA39HRQ3_9BILA|nr:hypothetical protein QR680_004687 [Steinernema hermaphroditum]